MQTVYFAPATADGTAWDSNDKIPSSVISGVASALAEPITAAVAAKVLDYLQDIAIDKYDNPDPTVYGYVLENGKAIYSGWLVDRDTNEEDNYAPQFVNVGLDNVPLGPKYSMQLDIEDEDISSHDSAGTPVITYDDLKQALKLNGKPYFINTSKEAVGQVIFVAISVFPAQ